MIVAAFPLLSVPTGRREEAGSIDTFFSIYRANCLNKVYSWNGKPSGWQHLPGPRLLHEQGAATATGRGREIWPRAQPRQSLFLIIPTLSDTFYSLRHGSVKHLFMRLVEKPRQKYAEKHSHSLGNAGSRTCARGYFLSGNGTDMAKRCAPQALSVTANPPGSGTRRLDGPPARIRR
jgi:hypothetical protein